MRPVLIGDVIAVSRVLLAHPPPVWQSLLADALHRADIADRFRKRFHRPHPEWGNGALPTALAPYPKRPEPFLTDPHYLDALILILTTLRDRRRK